MFKDQVFISNEIFTDYRAVTRAAGLIAQGIDIDQLELVPVGGDARGYGKEIRRITPYFAERSGEQRIRIEMNREGLYDMLPEGLFHTLAAGTEVLDEEVMIDDIRQKRQEERDARQFFAPFEIELNHHRLRLELYENRLDMQTSYNAISELLVPSWPELSVLNNRQRVIWMHFIPEIQHHKNDLVYLEQFLHLLLQIPVRVAHRTVSRPLTWISDAIAAESALGRGVLGVTTITQQAYETDLEVVEITLGPTYPDLLASYLPSEKDERIIGMTADYLLPADIEYRVVYDLVQEMKRTYLHDATAASHEVLGHTTFL